MSQTPLRRSSRIRSETGPEAPVPSVSRTGNRTRARRQPGGLPGLDSARSTAYGSRSRGRMPALESQLHAGESSLAATIERETGEAPIVEELVEEPEAAPTEEAPVTEEPEEPEEAPMGEQTAPPERSFGHEAITIRPLRTSSTQTVESRILQTEEEDAAVPESSIYVNFRTWIFWICLAIAALALSLSLKAAITAEATSVVRQETEALRGTFVDVLQRMVKEEIGGILPPSPPPPTPVESVEESFEFNYLSAMSGARIDPSLTSSTLKGTEGWIKKIYSSVWTPQEPNKPIAALMPWDDAEDAWCAAPAKPDKLEPDNNDGTHTRAQLAVVMKHSMYPTSFTIEHVPQTGTVDIATAPRWVELWIHVPDLALRDRLTEHINTVIGTRRLPEYDADGNQKPDPSAFLGRDIRPTADVAMAEQRKHNLGNDHTPPSDFVRVGKFHYNIEERRFIQIFELPVDLVGWVQTNKVLIRVTQNYGREWTCFYRVRLQGQLAEPATVYVDKEAELKSAKARSYW